MRAWMATWMPLVVCASRDRGTARCATSIRTVESSARRVRAPTHSATSIRTVESSARQVRVPMHSATSIRTVESSARRAHALAHSVTSTRTALARSAFRRSVRRRSVPSPYAARDFDIAISLSLICINHYKTRTASFRPPIYAFAMVCRHMLGQHIASAPKDRRTTVYGVVRLLAYIPRDAICSVQNRSPGR